MAKVKLLKTTFFTVIVAFVLFDLVVVLVWIPYSARRKLAWVSVGQLPLHNYNTHVNVAHLPQCIECFTTTQQQLHSTTTSSDTLGVHKRIISDQQKTSQYSNSSLKSPQLLSSSISSSPDAIRGDLIKCSTSMGVPLSRLTANEALILNISTSASRLLEAIRLLVPTTFLSRYQNPCWYSNIQISQLIETYLLHRLRPETGHGASKVMLDRFAISIFNNDQKHQNLFCLPYFFIAGFPKSATTSLSLTLSKHSQIVGPWEKEAHWWTRAHKTTFTNVEYAKLSVLTYLLFFKSLTSKLEQNSRLITFDGSQSTLWDSNFFQDDQDYCAMPAVLSRVLPKAKFIVLMRNPVTRVYSHFLWSCVYKFGKITEWPAEMRHNATELFHSLVTTDVGLFKECLQSRSLYECTNIWTNGRSSCGNVGHRLIIGLYYVHLYKWLQFYPKEQFLFLRMEDLAVDPVEVMSQITAFLGVDNVSVEDAKKWFSLKANAQMETIPEHEKFDMQARTMTLLQEFYKPYNTMLAQLLEDDNFLWPDDV